MLTKFTYVCITRLTIVSTVLIQSVGKSAFGVLRRPGGAQWTGGQGTGADEWIKDGVKIL